VRIVLIDSLSQFTATEEENAIFGLFTKIFADSEALLIVLG
jgi:archaellum biogenesis ATPase FlaH